MMVYMIDIFPPRFLSIVEKPMATYKKLCQLINHVIQEKVREHYSCNIYLMANMCKPLFSILEILW